MVKCCLIYDKCINAKRLFFFFLREDALNILFSERLDSPEIVQKL